MVLDQIPFFLTCAHSLLVLNSKPTKHPFFCFSHADFCALTRCPSNRCLFSVRINIHDQFHSRHFKLGRRTQAYFLKKMWLLQVLFSCFILPSVAALLGFSLNRCSLLLWIRFYTDLKHNEGKRDSQCFNCTLLPSDPSFNALIWFFLHVFSFILFSPPFFLLVFFAACLTSSVFLLLLLSGVLFLPSVSLIRFIFSSNYSKHTQAHTLFQWSNSTYPPVRVTVAL